MVGRKGSTDPLLPSNTIGNGASSSKYYFLNTGEGGTTDSVRDEDGYNVVESLPEGATEEEFAPRELPPVKMGKDKLQKCNNVTGPAINRGGLFAGLFGGYHGNQKYGDVGTLMKQRKAPIKIEPKVFFSNERTFLAWMHLSAILAGASIAILAFADDNPASQLYGVIMLPVAMSFIAYSMYQYVRRASMIRHRHPGPYEDTTGPTVLGIMLMISILAQFSLKLYNVWL